MNEYQRPNRVRTFRGGAILLASVFLMAQSPPPGTRLLVMQVQSNNVSGTPAITDISVAPRLWKWTGSSWESAATHTIKGVGPGLAAIERVAQLRPTENLGEHHPMLVGATRSAQWLPGGTLFNNCAATYNAARPSSVRTTAPCSITATSMTPGPPEMPTNGNTTIFNWSTNGGHRSAVARPSPRSTFNSAARLLPSLPPSRRGILLKDKQAQLAGPMHVMVKTDDLPLAGVGTLAHLPPSIHWRPQEQRIIGHRAGQALKGAVP